MALNERYSITIDGKNVVVSVSGYNRATAHPIDQGFSIVYGKRSRRMNLSVEAIDLWRTRFYGKRSLFEVQNAVNTLYVLYQEPTADNVAKLLRRGTAAIKLADGDDLTQIQEAPKKKGAQKGE